MEETIQKNENSYDQVVKILAKLSFEFSKKYNFDYGELFSEANLAFTIAYNEFNPMLSKFSTWIYGYVSKHLFYYINNYRKKKRVKEISLDFIENASEIFEDVSFNFEKFYNELSPDSKKIIDIILKSSKLKKKIKNSSSYVKHNRNIVAHALHKFMPGEKIVNCFIEIADSLV